MIQERNLAKQRLAMPASPPQPRTIGAGQPGRPSEGNAEGFVCRCGRPGCGGVMCLEWLRALPAQEANAYLTGCGGLGRKSCA
eukprot:scaffold381202_cov38-Prasinocladus_malaysianus.AAC.2